jgi:2-iminobutanoate/2-iminopropanoate deaminase
MKQTVFSPDALPVLPVFSQAVISDGKVYLSGNIGCTKEFKIVEGGVKAQTVSLLQATINSSLVNLNSHVSVLP